MGNAQTHMAVFEKSNTAELKTAICVCLFHMISYDFIFSKNPALRPIIFIALIFGFLTVVLRLLKIIRREKAISRSKSEFISLAVHQLRAPLAAIKWVFGIILDGDAGPINEEARSLLAAGFDASGRMIDLANNLLNAAKIEEGYLSYKFESGNLVETIQNVVNAFSLFAAKSSVSLIFFPPPKPAPNLFYDREKLSLALGNLFDNAIRYSRQPGGKVEVRLNFDSGFVRIDIKDNGIGIPQKEKARLFVKFNRGSEATRRYAEGAGLGLYSVQKIVKRHGGEIKVESKEGQGSVFSVILPVDKNKIPQAGEFYE
jgi:two-component system, OmpR family, phosphate regulon sensor histidine kinase PhoR